MKKIVIIGAGVAGVYLSILLKQAHPQLQVIVLEQNQTSLKKLLATGNGRCNLSNRDMDITYYQSDDQALVDQIIHQFDMSQAMDQLGLYTIYQGNLLYPKSEQALSVKHILMQEAIEAGVVFIYGQEVIHIKKGYQVYTNDQCYHCDAIVLAMGSEAGKLSGIHSTRYDILKKLQINVITPSPSLTQMYTKPVLRSLKGVRVKGQFSLLENDQVIHQETGELLFTDYGVSGIAIMQLSSFMKADHHYQLSIDFFCEKDENNLREYIELRQKKAYNHVYDGLFHTKLVEYFQKQQWRSASQIVSQLKDFRLQITGLRSYETAQVMKGGLSLKEVDHDLQLKKYPHIYAVGEILNVAGMCGGYNLHFACASAYHVAKALEGEEYA